MNIRIRSWTRRLRKGSHLVLSITPQSHRLHPRDQGNQSRGPSRSHPLHLGMVILAARRDKDFPHFDDLMKCVLPCEIEEAAAFFSLEQWVTRLTYCNTHEEEVMDIFRLFDMHCWSERDLALISYNQSCDMTSSTMESMVALFSASLNGVLLNPDLLRAQ